MNIRSILACIVIVAFSQAAHARDFVGKVIDQTGRPVADATVIVISAQPRTGRATTCPTCYEDCGRTAKTGPDGQYVMLEFDTTLSYRLAAIADGRRAHLVEGVVPTGRPINFSLEALPMELPPGTRVRGRVLDPAGKPIAGALVEPKSRQVGTRTSFGALTQYGVDPVAVTNSKGEFLITSTEPADGFGLDVKAPRFAPKRFELLPTGDDVEKNKLAVDEGGAVRGRLVRDGKPAEGALVGVAHIDRSSRVFAGHFETSTDADGKFEFQYLPKVDFYLYTQMGGPKGQGALPIDFLPLANATAPREMGDLELGPAHTLSGRIVLTDRPRLPSAYTLSLGRQGAWDPQQVNVFGEGAFRFEDVPHDESVTLTVRIPGYRVASRGNRFQQTSATAIALHVDQPREGIEIVFEPVPPVAPAAATFAPLPAGATFAPAPAAAPTPAR